MDAKWLWKRDAYNTINQFSTNFQISNEKLLEIAKLLGVEVRGVPFTVIADKVFMGFNYELR